MAVFISGANGFIALHIVNDLLEAGYNVIGSVRSQEKADQLHNKFRNPNLSLFIINDISKSNAFDEVFLKHGKNIRVVLHTASPFHYDTDDFQRDLLTPAVNGTSAILEAIKKHASESVERVVITSSDAAVASFEDDTNPANLLTEKSWNTISWEEACKNSENAYYGSKTFAERTAWKFWRENENTVKFKLTTVNPVWVFGPQMFDENASDRLNTSCQYIKELLNSSLKDKIDAEIGGGYVDVRDVSKAHLIAFQREESIGQRLVLCAGRFNLFTMVDILTENFPQLKGRIAKGDTAQGLKQLKSLAKYNYAATNKILDFEFIPFQTTVCDTAAQILKMETRL